LRLSVHACATKCEKCEEGKVYDYIERVLRM